MADVAKLPYVEHFEFCLNSVAPAFTVYFIYLLRRPFFHLNLRILLANFSIGLSALTISRNVILLHDSLKFLSTEVAVAFHIVHNACVFAIMDAAILIAGERLVASWIAEKYEKVRKWWIAVGLCLFMWVFNGLLGTEVVRMAFIVYKQAASTMEEFFVPLLIIFSIVMILNCIGVVAFFLIHKYNKKCWRRDLQRRLTHRYQIMENIRTSRQLLVALLFDFIISIYVFGVLMYRLRTSPKDVTLSVLSQIVDLTCAITSIMMPCLFIRSHPRLKYVANRQLCKGKARRAVNIFNRTTSVVPSDRVAITETNIYFSQLEKSWAIDLKK
ncbi:hypothetical protein QR680_016885 [Steinernema hermaphroditum]|uniref:Uncharacterized protein n=1 Tax=Steinernema hermaphroditum TaxID=289476 RepID=A0AA39HDK3_9BILA|nr:hypothetical protein QR680_016885 [Steinernema hermaphroditum]